MRFAMTPPSWWPLAWWPVEGSAMSGVVSETQVRQRGVSSGSLTTRRPMEIVALVLDGGSAEVVILLGEYDSEVVLESFGLGVIASIVRTYQSRQISSISGRVSTVGTLVEMQTRQSGVSYGGSIKGLIQESQKKQITVCQGEV